MRGVVNVRGKAIPVADPRRRFGLPLAAGTLLTRIVVMELELDGETTVVGGVADTAAARPPRPAAAPSRQTKVRGGGSPATAAPGGGGRPVTASPIRRELRSRAAGARHRGAAHQPVARRRRLRPQPGPRVLAPDVRRAFLGSGPPASGPAKAIEASAGAAGVQGSGEWVRTLRTGFSAPPGGSVCVWRKTLS